MVEICGPDFHDVVHAWVLVCGAGGVIGVTEDGEGLGCAV